MMFGDVTPAGMSSGVQMVGNLVDVTCVAPGERTPIWAE